MACYLLSKFCRLLQTVFQFSNLWHCATRKISKKQNKDRILCLLKWTIFSKTNIKGKTWHLNAQTSCLQTLSLMQKTISFCTSLTNWKSTKKNPVQISRWFWIKNIKQITWSTCHMRIYSALRNIQKDGGRKLLYPLQ